MARGQQRNQPLIREAGQALNRFKYEVAQEIAQTPNDPQAQLLQQYLSGQTGGYGGDIPSPGLGRGRRPHGAPHDRRGRADVDFSSSKRSAAKLSPELARRDHPHLPNADSGAKPAAASRRLIQPDKRRVKARLITLRQRQRGRHRPSPFFAFYGVRTRGPVDALTTSSVGMRTCRGPSALPRRKIWRSLRPRPSPFRPQTALRW